MGIGVVGGTVGGRVGCDRARGADLAHRWTLQFRQVAGGRLDILSWWLYYIYTRGGSHNIYEALAKHISNQPRVFSCAFYKRCFTLRQLPS